MSMFSASGSSLPPPGRFLGGRPSPEALAQPLRTRYRTAVASRDSPRFFHDAFRLTSSFWRQYSGLRGSAIGARSLPVSADVLVLVSWARGRIGRIGARRGRASGGRPGAGLLGRPWARHCWTARCRGPRLLGGIGATAPARWRRAARDDPQAAQRVPWADRGGGAPGRQPSQRVRSPAGCSPAPSTRSAARATGPRPPG